MPRRHATRSPSSNCPPASAAVTAPPLGGSYKVTDYSRSHVSKQQIPGHREAITLHCSEVERKSTGWVMNMLCHVVARKGRLLRQT